MASENIRYAFLTEWYDEQASLTRSYQLLFYPSDQACEMFDLKSRRTFLRRTKLESLSLQQLYIGAIVHVLSRQLKIIDYGDEFTLKRLGGIQCSFLLVGGEVLENLSVIFATLAKQGLTLCSAKTVSVDKQSAQQIAREMPQASALLGSDGGDSLLVVSVNASNAIALVAELSGGLPGPVYFSQDSKTALRDIDVFFGGDKGQGRVPMRSTVGYGQEAVLGIVKPHALTEGLVGPILQGITDAGFKVRAVKLFFVDRRNVEEFLEVRQYNIIMYTVRVLLAGVC